MLYFRETRAHSSFGAARANNDPCLGQLFLFSSFFPTPTRKVTMPKPVGDKGDM